MWLQRPVPPAHWLSQLWCLSDAPLAQVRLGQQGFPWPSCSP